MTILTTLRTLINGSPTAQKATQDLIQILAREAIDSGNPGQLIAVAAQWEEMLEGRSTLLEFSQNSQRALPASVEVDYTTADQLRPIVIEVMQSAYANGVTEMTTGSIQKGVDRVQQHRGAWTDADLEDVDPRPGIQHRWKRTLSQALRNMRDSGDIRNDPQAYYTYTLCPKNIPPQLRAAEESYSVEKTTGSWEVVG